MLGLWNAHAQTYLLVVVATTTPAFALPIFLVPLRWARVLGWRVPEHTDLAVYFGRCLGAFVLIIEALMLRAGLTGEGLLYAYQVIVGGRRDDGAGPHLGRPATHSAAVGDPGDRHVWRARDIGPAVLARLSAARLPLQATS